MREEIEILRILDHPNIIKLHACFEEDNYYYLVTELMNGGELFDRICVKHDRKKGCAGGHELRAFAARRAGATCNGCGEGPFPAGAALVGCRECKHVLCATCQKQSNGYSEREARDVIRLLLDAVGYCHRNNVVHRDLKPENLLLVSETDDATVKLADFGFAERVAGPLTMQCGTPSYVAPEIYLHRPYGLAVDMWSVGVISFILLGGYPPFYSNEQADMIKKITKCQYKFHSKFWGHIHEDAKDLVTRMLDLNPETRLTATQALEHRWLKAEDAALAGRKLYVNHEELKKFNARRKLRAAGDAVRMINVLRKATMMSVLDKSGGGQTGEGGGALPVQGESSSSLTTSKEEGSERLAHVTADQV